MNLRRRIAKGGDLPPRSDPRLERLKALVEGLPSVRARPLAARLAAEGAGDAGEGGYVGDPAPRLIPPVKMRPLKKSPSQIFPGTQKITDGDGRKPWRDRG